MAADEYNDNGETEYDSEEESYTEDDDNNLWDLTGIYHAREESETDVLPESVPFDRRKNDSDGASQKKSRALSEDGRRQGEEQAS